MADRAPRAPRPAARLLLIDSAGRLLLFRFTPDDRAPFWCTAGGAVDPGESFEDAARRELFEETGLSLDPGPEVARREVAFTTLEGVPVIGDERYFLIRTPTTDIATHGHTELERRVMQDWRWFTRAELADWPETIYPRDIIAMLDALMEAAP
ncbi:NUDIX hydrolase [Sphingomonas sp. GlSt437]|uniref:NUDIX hydrolase n=1 Tax=Sphingomonas sp. GlSt437 TaxID=3389970 RepID=UPI003A852D0E